MDVSRRTVMKGAALFGGAFAPTTGLARNGSAQTLRYEVIGLGGNNEFTANMPVDDTAELPLGMAMPMAASQAGAIAGIRHAQARQVFRCFGSEVEIYDIPEPHASALEVLDQRVMIAGEDIILTSVLGEDDPGADSPYDILTLLYHGGNAEPVESLTGNAPMLPLAANDEMQMVGMLSVEVDVAGALWIDGQTYQLTDLLADGSGFTITQPIGINNGEIPTYVIDQDAIEHGVILIPV